MDHSALVVRDLERSSWFYGQVLGLEEVPRPSTFTFRGRWFRGKGFELHLILAADTSAMAGFGAPVEAARVGLAHHLGFEVPDVNESLAHLRREGVEVVAGPITRGDGVIQVYVNDPDGNFLEFFAWDRHSTLPLQDRPALQTQER